MESINRSFCDSLGMPTVGDLFFDAQRDYVERFVLGIDPRRHEINQEVSMLKTGGRPLNRRLLNSAESDQIPNDKLVRRGRFEG